MEIALEPYLIKAIGLLHSKAKDSGDQLKAMLDDAIRQRNENQSLHSKLPPPLTNIIKKDNKKKCDILNDEDIPLSKRRKESPRSSQPSSPATSSIEKKSESRRKCEMFSEEDCSPAKRLKDSPRSSRPSSPMSRSPQQSGSFSPLPGSVRKSDDSNSLLDADDLAQEIMDLHCVICNGLDVSPGNQLVECQECHGLYHQECHHPPISDAEVNDPRLVWYCSTCSKTMKKTTGKPKPNRESPITFKSRSDSPSIGGSSKSSHSTGFKSATNKTSTKSASSSSSSTSSSSSSSNVTSSLISADKRLQIIKKRAASKLQEKRKPTK